MSAFTLSFRKVAWPVFALLFILNYLPTLTWMVIRWEERDSYISHGWLIPFVSLWLLWMERDKIRALPMRGHGSGLVLMAVFLALHGIAGLADVSSISGLTMIPVLYGFLILLNGLAWFKALWFPIFFLFFMVPPPEFVISGMNFQLKLLAADMGAGLLNLTGMPAIREGSFILFGEEKLAIGDVCSGLRSLLTLFSLGVLYAWLVRHRSRMHVAAVLLAAIPAAVIGNGIRICLVSYLVFWLGKEAVFQPLVGTWDLHLFTGSVIFIGAFGVLYLTTWVLDRIKGNGPSPGPSKASVPPPPSHRKVSVQP